MFLRKCLEFLFHRVVIVALMLLIQVAAIVLVIWKFNAYFVYFYAFCGILSIVVVLHIVNGNSNPSYKIAWIIPILLFPIFGGLFYIMFGGSYPTAGIRRKLSVITEKAGNALQKDHKILEELEKIDLDAAKEATYIQNYAGCPPFQNTSTEYLKLGEEKFERLVEELKKDKRFIFLEYFIIQEGLMWNTILEVLIAKVKQGVDVRVIYDDMGCIMLLPKDYDKKLEALGIKCCVFNRFIPILTTRLNNRDHRKIAIIDGDVAFTGGINLADEYINKIDKHGHWKDTAMMLKGEGVWGFTVMFLSMWAYLRKTDEDFSLFRSEKEDYSSIENGVVQPYTDSPLDGEAVGETIYLNIINRAKKYVYITSPYLIIDNEMITALSVAAKSGVDVRIITPHIGDKWFVHALTRANYHALVKNGVKVYEYTPGFIHAKSFVSDDKYGVIGTVNLDYRSLYLHFECGVWMYQTSSISQMKKDYFDTLEKCQQITLEDCKKRGLLSAILRVFAPLM